MPRCPAALLAQWREGHRLSGPEKPCDRRRRADAPDTGTIAPAHLDEYSSMPGTWTIDNALLDIAASARIAVIR
jgi:hypothetical protein